MGLAVWSLTSIEGPRQRRKAIHVTSNKTFNTLLQSGQLYKPPHGRRHTVKLAQKLKTEVCWQGLAL